MKVESTRFGTLTVADDARVFFPEGLLGFGAFREYVMVPSNESGGPVTWLQSAQVPELAFALCAVDALMTNYHIAAPKQDLASIEVEQADEADIYVIIYRDRNGLVANLRGPLLVNARKSLGKQFVINDDRLPLRYRITTTQRAGRPARREADEAVVVAETGARKAV